MITIQDAVIAGVMGGVFGLVGSCIGAWIVNRWRK